MIKQGIKIGVLFVVTFFIYTGFIDSVDALNTAMTQEDMLDFLVDALMYTAAIALLIACVITS